MAIFPDPSCPFPGFGLGLPYDDCAHTRPFSPKFQPGDSGSSVPFTPKFPIQPSHGNSVPFTPKFPPVQPSNGGSAPHTPKAVIATGYRSTPNGPLEAMLLPRGQSQACTLSSANPHTTTCAFEYQNPATKKVSQHTAACQAIPFPTAPGQPAATAALCTFPARAPQPWCSQVPGAEFLHCAFDNIQAQQQH